MNPILKLSEKMSLRIIRKRLCAEIVKDVDIRQKNADVSLLVYLKRTRLLILYLLVAAVVAPSVVAANGGEAPKSEEVADNNLKPYVFLHVNILREYLEHALKFNVPGVPWDLERAIDDWVFMCFFVGNDFLPHLPSLEIREGAISKLSLLWKQCMPFMGGYMTKDGDVDLKRVQVLVSELGNMEDAIFRERRESKKKEQLANMSG